jgi:hypothetical protein
MTLGGWRYSGSNESLNGELSNVCLWKTALTDGVGGQIEELYNNGMPLLELSEIPQNNNLLGWYKLNQSAVLTPGVPTNWTITKIGNPNYGSAVDGCYVADNSNSTPTIYNTGGLIWHDNDSGTTVGSDYFQWNSPIIYTSGSNIVLSSSGGSYLEPYYGSQAILEYNIDNGSWVTWHTQTNGPGGFSANSFSIPSTGNLTVSNNIQIRIKGVDRGSNGSFLRINDVNATGGTSSYSENFNSNTTKYGFFANSETQPPATFSADHWDIPDNRSPYPQSFNFDNALTTPAPSFDSYFNPDGYTKLTFSIWAYAENYYNRGTFFATFENTANKYSDSNFRISPSRNRFNVSINGDFICALNIGGAFQSITPNNVWNCITVVYDGTFTDADTATQNAGRLKFYTNGVYKAFDGFSNDVPSSIISNSLGSRIGVSNPTQGNAALRSPFLGKLSNLQIWDTNLLASDALTLYNNGAPLPTASVEPSSLKAWYKLDNNDVWNPVLNQWEIIDYAN